MGLIGWVFAHKLLLLFFVVAFSFGNPTVELYLDDDLETCEEDEVPTESIPSTSTPVPSTETLEPEDMENYRLPRNIIPESYDLTLYPNLETKLFEGKLVAIVNVTEDSDELKIHSNGLQITATSIDGETLLVKYLEKYELLVLTLAENKKIEKGQRIVTIEYDGNMADRIVGLYTSRYIGEDGTARSIAISKFEPTYARQAFPCFDEPDMKANYTVHIEIPTDYIALSNMPEASESKIDTKSAMVHFQESVKMSTYLSCFIVCDFESTEKNITPTKGEPFKLQVYAAPAQKAKTTYALQIAEAVIRYFVDYFDIEYPLPKLDLIAIPDFVPEGMEHWGLVTFSETALLYDPSTSSSAIKQRVASVVSYQLAHSWFGNLVTMQWWNDLWLTKGFALYIQYKAVHDAERNWQMNYQFLIEILHPALSIDATPASHPIVQTVVTPDEITEVFDCFVYSKGASILRMLQYDVGIQKGVRDYLKNNAYKNAVTQDFLNELQKQVNTRLNVTEFVNTWISQKGYPILTVKQIGNKYILTQKRFLKNYENAEDIPSPYNYKWTIRVHYSYGVIDKPNIFFSSKWFNYNDEQLEIEKPEKVKWIKFNRDQIGYYRVNYSPDHWKLLIDNIGVMSIYEKIHLLEESFSIAESGDLAYDVPLELSKYLKNEINYIPWSVASSEFEKLRKYLIDSEEYSKCKEYVTRLSSYAYKYLTWSESPTEAHLRKRARATVLELACSVGHEDCLNEASKLFKAWLIDPVTNPVLPDLRSIVYHYGMVKSGANEWGQLLEMYRKEMDANEKLNMLRGLAAVREPSTLLSRLIDVGNIVGDEQMIRDQDYFTMLQFISSNPVGTPIVWDYVRENWQSLVDRFTLNDRNLGRLISAITKSFVTQTKLDEMIAFFKLYPEAGAGQRARAEALENVRNNIKWREKNLETVEKWLRSFFDPPP